jgi:hypothetical protein
MHRLGHLDGLAFRGVVVVLLASVTASPAGSQVTTTTNCSLTGPAVNCTSRAQSDPNSAWLRLAAANLQIAAARQAAEAQAAWAAAGRRAEQAAATARQRAEETATAIPRLLDSAVSSPATLAPINDHLTIAWRLLDGVSTRWEMKLPENARRLRITRLAVVPTPDGSAFVQLRSEGDLTVPQGFGRVSLGREVLDGRFDLATGSSLHTLSREPLRFDVPPAYEALALIGEFGFVARMAGTRETRVPPGAVPSPMLNFAVAAIPGPLPDSLRVWVLDWESGNLLPADFSIRSRGEINVPMVRTDDGCNEKAKVAATPTRVVTYRVRIGTLSEERVFLADAPHVAVVAETHCIGLRP